MRGDLVVERGTGNMWGRILTAAVEGSFFRPVKSFLKLPLVTFISTLWSTKFTLGLQSIGHFLKSVDMEHLFEIIQP